MATTTAPAKAPIESQPLGSQIGRSAARASRSAFAALLYRDLAVLKKNLREFIPRTIIQPFLLVFVFLYVFPKIGQGVGGGRAGGESFFATILVAGVVGLSILFQGIQSVALPMVQEFGYTKEIEDRVLAPLPVSLVAIGKVVAGALQGLVAACVVFPIAAFVHAAGVVPHLTIHWAILLTMIPLACITTASLGLTFGTKFDPRQVPALFALIILPITFLGGTYYAWTTLHAVQVGVGGVGNQSSTVYVGLLTMVAVVQVGSLFSSDAWNNVTFTAGEIKNPKRNIPLSLAIGTGVVLLLYVLCNFVYLSVLPMVGDPAVATIAGRGIQFASEDRVATAVMEQAGSSLGAVGAGFGAKLMAAVILISTFGCVNGLLMAGARVYYAMSRDGLFFKSVGKLSEKSKTPVNSLWVQWAWTCLLCLSGSYGQLLDYVIFAVLVFYILTITGLFVLRRTRPEAVRPYKAFGYPVLPGLYIVMAGWISVVLLRYKPQYTWPGLIVVLLGVPVYLVWRREGMPVRGKADLGTTGA